MRNIIHQRYYFGLDPRTSGLRALLVDESGLPITSSEGEYLVRNPFAALSASKNLFDEPATFHLI